MTRAEAVLPFVQVIDGLWFTAIAIAFMVRSSIGRARRQLRPLLRPLRDQQ